MSSIQEPKNEIILRDPTADDLEAINDIYNHYVLTSTCTYQEEPETIDARKVWFESHGPNHPVIVAEDSGEVVEYIRLKLAEGVEDYFKYSRLLIDEHFELLMFKEEEIDLEDVFLQVTKGHVA